MGVPDYQTLLLPLLKLADEAETKTSQAAARFADQFGLSEQDRGLLLPSGEQTVIANRTHWAATYLVKAGLLERPKRGWLRTTAEGKKLLSEAPTFVNSETLMRYASFREFKKKAGLTAHSDLTLHSDNTNVVNIAPVLGTPEERIGAAKRELDAALTTDLLDRIINSTPAFFEHLIIDLMLAMGYGKSGKSEHRGRSNDGGIDGIISEDALGLDLVFLQAKRYQPGNVIGVEKIQAFVGSLVGQGAHRGVFVTTSHFSPAAKAYATRTPQRIILIDGEELTSLCIRYSVGVRVHERLELKRIDLDYFRTEDEL